MEKIKNVLSVFEDNLKQVDQLGEIGSDVGNILLDMLENLKSDNEQMPAFLPYKQKLDNVIDQIKKLKDHSILTKKYSIIYNQSVVLIVASFESFMNDLVRDIIDYHSEIVSWPEKKQISFDPDVLKYSSPTIGGLIIRSSLREKYNFQDLQSTINFLKDYLGLEVNIVKDLKDSLIECQALRNAIMHNSAKIDERFLKQVRNINTSTQYNNGDPINLNKTDYAKAKDSFEKFASEIVRMVLSKK
ncbi:MAG: hypothetical protein WC238_05310 [Parcubacteria group bacterium]|jgi:hypothetical protein